MRLKVCGPKYSICCSVVSLWGIIMLVLLGIFFYIKSPSLSEDITIDAKHWSLEKLYEGYRINSYNCFIAAAIYVITLAFSLYQYYLNTKGMYSY